MNMKNPFEEDKVELSEDKLGIVAVLANDMSELETEIEELEEQLKEKKKELRNFSEYQLPEKLLEMGLTKLELSDGTILNMMTYYSAKIPDERKSEAFAWLKANKFDSIIKSRVECAFGKGEEEKRQREQVIGYLSTQGVPFSDKTSVHASTLKSFVKEQIESGTEFPNDLFGVYVGKKIKIRKK